MSTPNEKEPLALDLLLSADERRPITVEAHQQFRESLSADAEIDELVEALRAGAFEEEGARP